MHLEPVSDVLKNLKLLHRGLFLEYFSIGWMSVEASVSISAGILAGSLALVAFGGDSVIELLSAYAVASFLRSMHQNEETAIGVSGLPHSERTGKIATALLFALVPTIAIGAGYSYFAGITAKGSPVGIAVATCAAALMPYLWVEKSRIGREMGWRPLSIDAIESATCFFMAVALLGGLLVEFFLKMGWVDYVATGIILTFVAREAVESYRELSSKAYAPMLYRDNFLSRVPQT